MEAQATDLRATIRAHNGGFVAGKGPARGRGDPSGDDLLSVSMERRAKAVSRLSGRACAIHARS
eukprot:13783144-Alexandrium_andersonii.AAC.2